MNIYKLIYVNVRNFVTFVSMYKILIYGIYKFILNIFIDVETQIILEHSVKSKYK